jgi:hypothetical protein
MAKALTQPLTIELKLGEYNLEKFLKDYPKTRLLILEEYGQSRPYLVFNDIFLKDKPVLENEGYLRDLTEMAKVVDRSPKTKKDVPKEFLTKIENAKTVIAAHEKELRAVIDYNEELLEKYQDIVWSENYQF